MQNIYRFTISIFLLAIGTFATAAAIHKNALNLIDVHVLPNKVTEITIEFSQKINNPVTFLTNNKEDLVLDFPAVENHLKKNKVDIKLGQIRGYEVVTVSDRTRVVLKIIQPSTYEVIATGKKVILTLKPVACIAPPPPPPVVYQQEPKLRFIHPPIVYHGLHQLMSFSFKRVTENCAGQLVMTLSDANVRVNYADRSGIIYITFENTTIPLYLQKRFDVSSYGTPVKAVDFMQNEGNAKVRVFIAGQYQQRAYYSGNQFIVNVGPMSNEESLLGIRAKTTNFVGRPLTLNFQNISVRAALQILSEFSAQNIVVSDTVQGDMTLRLNNIPWDEALAIILQTRGLGMWKIGKVIIVAPSAEIATREKENLLAHQQVNELAPLRSELIAINYGKAADIAVLLRGSGGTPILSARGSVSVDSRTNTLWIQDTSDKLLEIRDLVKRLDVATRQVLIEARIVSIEKDYERDLGIRWGITRPNSLSGTLSGANQIQKSGGDAAGVTPYTERLNVDLPAINANGLQVGSIGLALARLADHTFLDLELSALETENVAKVIASPQLITANQKEALIESGEQIPYQQATASGATAVQFINAVLSLKVTPQITPDDKIDLDLDVHQDKKGTTTVLGVPSIDTRSVTSHVLVNNGETIVIGGIYQKNSESELDRVPFFSDIPIFGILFQHTHRALKTSELLIFITPKIVKPSLSQNTDP